jgi:hypothetical protein
MPKFIPSFFVRHAFPHSTSMDFSVFRVCYIPFPPHIP